MADGFTPKFVDLVRNYVTTVGTGNFALGPAVNGYSSFAAAVQPGDSFYYSAIGIDKPAEREVGRGTMQADGTISRIAIGGTLTSFTGGTKTLSLTAAAEWFTQMQAGGAAGSTSGGGGAGIDLAAHGVSPAGVSNAAAIEAAIAATTGNRGDWFILPEGVIPLERELVIRRPVVLQGRGASIVGGGQGLGGTTLQVPAGCNGIRFAYDAATGGAQHAALRDVYIYQPVRRTTSAVGSYTPGSPSRLTITSGTNDFANGQIVQIEGAGPSLTLPGRTGTINAGSNVVVVTNNPSAIGNPGVHIGQQIDVAGAGLPAGTTVTGWDSGSITLSSNAAASVASAAITVRYPLFAEVISGAGTATLTLDNSPDNTQAITGAKVSHADCGVLAHVALQMDSVQVGGFSGPQALFSADATDGNPAGRNVNVSKIRNCKFFTGFAGLVFQQADANACAVTACDFTAGVQYGVLDLSLIGNSYASCHFAFNVGIACPLVSQWSHLSGGYFEAGTSYIAHPSGSCSFSGPTGMINGSGWTGVEIAGGGITLPNLTLSGTLQASGDLKVGRGFRHYGSTYRFRVENTAPGDPAGTAGTGLSVYTNTGRDSVVLQADFGSYKPMELAASQIYLRPANVLVGTWDSSGVNLAAGKALKVNGTTVLSGQMAHQADSGAADVAALKTDFNALLAKLQSVGLMA